MKRGEVQAGSEGSWAGLEECSHCRFFFFFKVKLVCNSILVSGVQGNSKK